MNTTKTTVIYHKSDFDGIFCREIAKKFIPDAELIGWEYGEPEPIVPADHILYILDLSVPGLMNHPNLIWIDHHKSAIEKYGPGAALFDYKGNRHAYCIDGVAACRLAWQWFQGESSGFFKEAYVKRNVKEPIAVRLAGEYDIWDKRDPNAELFQHGLRSEELDAHRWSQLLDNTVPKELNGTGNEWTTSELITNHLLKQGRALQYAKANENESIIRELGFDRDWEGLTFLCCNNARYNSFLFTAGLKPHHDACLGFKWTGKDWSVSLYHAPGKEHHDLSLIAVKYGGGGHRGACGFRMTNSLPFLP